LYFFYHFLKISNLFLKERGHEGKMKKIGVFLLTGFLFLFLNNVFAGSGDLIVEGNLGVGSTNPSEKLEVNGKGVFNVNSSSGFSEGVKVMAERSNTSSLSNALFGAENVASYTGSGSLTSDLALVGTFNRVLIKSASAEGATVEGANGIVSSLFIHESTVGPVINNYAAFKSRGVEVESGWFDVMSFYHFYASDVPYMGVEPGKSLYGMLIEKQTGGDNNYGIVLNGDGEGADIVFGYNQETRLYGSGGDFIIDTTGNVGIGTTTPAEKFEVAGRVKAQEFVTGDITFQKGGEKLWRMFEDEDGLYIENLKTGKVYRFVLQEVEK